MQVPPAAAVHPLATIKNLGKNMKIAVAVAIQQFLGIIIVIIKRDTRKNILLLSHNGETYLVAVVY